MQSSLNMAPYMVESAFRYYRAAQSLWVVESGIALVNAAISIEILLKSYNSEIAGNEEKINQKYRFKSACLKKGENSHNLIHLFNALPLDAKAIFNEPYIEELLEKYKTTFVSERYVYEPNTRGGGSTALIDLANILVQRTVSLYKEHGCEDSWVVNYPNV